MAARSIYDEVTLIIINDADSVYTGRDAFPIFVDEIEKDKERFLGQDISVIINQMRYAVIDEEIKKYAEKLFEEFQYPLFSGYSLLHGAI